MLNIENKFHGLLEDYYAELPDELQESCWQAFTSLRNQSRTYEWIYTAITNKPVEHWKERKFGLLFTESYQQEIDNKIAAKQSAAKKAEKNKDKYFELYDKYYAEYQVSGPITNISKQIISKDMVKNGRKLDPDNKITFWGPYKESISEEGFFFFGTNEEFWDYMGYNKEPEVVYWTPPSDKEWRESWEKRMNKKKKLWDIH